MRVGKKFEQIIKDSIPKEWFVYRLRDQASAFGDKEKTKFTVSNICDFMIFDGVKLGLFELKTCQGKAFSFDDRAMKQYERLKKETGKKNLITGFIINYRDYDITIFYDIFMISRFFEATGMKTLNIEKSSHYGFIIPKEEKKRKNSKDVYILNELFKIYP